MPYVTAKLTSGLGNRFFQVAAMLGYAEQYGHTPVFIKEWIESCSHPGPKSITDFFPEIPVLQVVGTGAWHTITMPDSDAFRYVSLENCEKNVKLCGYFQSELYFPKKNITPECISNKGVVVPLGTAFMHVRRGDYLHPFNRHHYVDLDSYYRTALSLFPTDCMILVVSDDIPWCRDELPRRYGDIVGAHRWMLAGETTSDYHSLSLMSQCTAGGICANSTFSWWGAYFIENPDKIVTMPSMWGRPPLPPAVDIWPSWAVKI
jgi:hypothetical protein